MCEHECSALLDIFRGFATSNFLTAQGLQPRPFPCVRDIKWDFFINTTYYCTNLLIIRVIITSEDDRFLFVALNFSLFDEFFFFLTDTIQEDRSRFISGVLRDKQTTDGKVEDALFYKDNKTIRFFFIFFY